MPPLRHRFRLLFTALALTTSTALNGQVAPATRTAGALSGDPFSFRNGRTYVSPRVGVGLYGTASVGGEFEIPITRPAQPTSGIIGVGAGLDYYGYSESAGGFSASSHVIPISVFGNYHFRKVFRDHRWDPYLGLGLGYYIITWSSNVPGFTDSGFRQGGLFVIGRAGLRYFFSPNLAVHLQAGAGFAPLSLGVTAAF